VAEQILALPLLILAAGKSRRFGSEDKRFTALPHGGELINALVRRGRKAGLDVYVVLDPADDVSARIDAPCVFAPNAGVGMGASIADAVGIFAERSEAEALLIMPADLPLLRVESLRRVAEPATAQRIVIPTFEAKGGHPIAFGREYWPALSKLSGDEGGRSVIASARSEFVDVIELNDEGICLDADTPEQMSALLLKLRPVLR